MPPIFVSASWTCLIVSFADAPVAEPDSVLRPSVTSLPTEWTSRTPTVEPGSSEARTDSLLPGLGIPAVFGILISTVIWSESARTEPATQAGIEPTPTIPEIAIPATPGIEPVSCLTIACGSA